MEVEDRQSLKSSWLSEAGIDTPKAKAEWVRRRRVSSFVREAKERKGRTSESKGSAGKKGFHANVCRMWSK